MVFSENPEGLAAFYEKVLQKKPEWNEGGYSGWQSGSCYLTVGPHDKVKGKSQNPERIMFNFETEDVKGEFERIKSLGAAVITEPYQPEEDPKAWIGTLADPDGNYFQIVSPFNL